jgi:hypothetical protein
MMILERLEQIAGRAQLARDDGSLRQDLGKIERIGERVTSLVRSLEKITTAYGELVQVDAPDCSVALSGLQSMFENLALMATQSRAHQLFGATTDFAGRLGVEEKRAKAVEETLADVWASYSNEQQRSAVDRELLEVLSRSGLAVDTLLENYDRASFGLEMLEAKTLPGDGDVARLQTHITALSSVAEGLSRVVPDALATFFRQADSPEGAPLSALTPEVRAFLDEHDVAGRYSIRGRR